MNEPQAMFILGVCIGVILYAVFEKIIPKIKRNKFHRADRRRKYTKFY